MTDVLASIDHALAVQDATAYGDADWLPGDPLHDRPRGSLMGEQHIRPMFQVMADGVWLRARCVPCQVSWDGDDPCWMCGIDRPIPHSRDVVAAGMAAMFPNAIRTAAWAEAQAEAEAAVERLNEQMRAFGEQVRADMAERFGRDILPLSELQPPARTPRPIDFSCSFVPSVADPEAPTMAELADGVPLDGLFSGILTRPEPEPVLDERLTSIDPAEHRDRPVTIRPQDPDDTATRTGFFGRLTLPRARYPRPIRLENQENP